VLESLGIKKKELPHYIVNLLDNAEISTELYEKDGQDIYITSMTEEGLFVGDISDKDFVKLFGEKALKRSSDYTCIDYGYKENINFVLINANDELVRKIAIKAIKDFGWIGGAPQLSDRLFQDICEKSRSPCGL